MKLSDIEKQRNVKVDAINLSYEEKQRLLSIGIYEGVFLMLFHTTRKRNTFIYFVSGNYIALRKEETDLMEVHYEL